MPLPIPAQAETPIPAQAQTQTSFIKLALNTQGRDFFIGDLHGNGQLLDALLAHVAFNPDLDRVISVGDLIDHGPDSLGAVQRLRDAPWFHAVRGNHEAMALGAYGLMRSHFEDPMELWYHNGGGWIEDLNQSEVTDVLLTLNQLPYAIEIPLQDGRRVGVVHAEVMDFDGWPSVHRINVSRVQADDVDARTRDGSLLWSRSLAVSAFALITPGRVHWTKDRKKLVIDDLKPIAGIDLLITGHSITPHYQPIAVSNRLLLDTGPCKPNGQLTLAHPVAGRYWQVGWSDTQYEVVGAVTEQALPTPITKKQAGKILKGYS